MSVLPTGLTATIAWSNKTLLNYAVSFKQVDSTSAASLAFLHNLGVVTKPSATPTELTLTAPGVGDLVVPAVLVLSGLFFAGDIVDATFESDVPFIGQAPYTVLETSTAADVAVQWAAYISGIDQLTAKAVGNTVEVRAFPPGGSVTVTAPIYTPIGAPFEPSIVVITDPEDLPAYSDQAADIVAAFEGGLTRVYLVLVEDVADIPALIENKECDFYTIYGSLDFTGEEYSQAFIGWQGVGGWTTNDEVAGAVWAADDSRSVFFEETATLPEVSAYFGIYSFAALLAATEWRNQQYIPVNTLLGNPVVELNKADLLFDERLSFYLQDDEQGVRLAFFVAGGKSITTPYIDEELRVVIQSDMLNFLSANQPMNIETNRRLLQQVGNKVIQSFIDRSLLDPDGTNTLTITKSNEVFIVDGEMTTSEAVALWRVQIDAKQETA